MSVQVGGSSSSPSPELSAAPFNIRALQVDMLLTSATHAKYHLSPMQARDSASLGRGMRWRAPIALVRSWRAQHPGLPLL